MYSLLTAGLPTAGCATTCVKTLDSDVYHIHEPYMGRRAGQKENPKQRAKWAGPTFMAKVAIDGAKTIMSEAYRCNVSIRRV